MEVIFNHRTLLLGGRYAAGERREVGPLLGEALINAGAARPADGEPVGPEGRMLDHDGHPCRAFGVGPFPVPPPHMKKR
jgi:hypothetical protein